jgi:signal transduction histidine kinase
VNEDLHISALVERLGVGTQLTRGVLLVDDEPFNLRVLGDLLEDRWVIHQAASGAEALAVAERVPLDVVVTDQRMPGMTGVDLLAELRSRGRDAAGIVITGFADLRALELAINKASAFRFLRKPWEADDVVQAVEQASVFVERGRTIRLLVEQLALRSEELRGSLETLQAQQRAMLHLERIGTIGRLSAGLAHDLRNVMAGLRAAEEELHQLDLAAGLRDLLSIGLAHVDQLLRTLQTLRDYSRGGTLQLEAVPTDAAAVIENAVAIACMDLKYRRHRVERSIEAGLPPFPGDGQKLTQVLVNLIRNGMQAAQRPSVVLVGARTLPGGQVELSVEDEGPGVPADLRDSLFQPFVSGKGEAGLGLGLYLSRLIVESHGGRIGVSQGGRGGARFEVVLPGNGTTTLPGGTKGGADGAPRAV